MYGFKKSEVASLPTLRSLYLKCESILMVGLHSNFLAATLIIVRYMLMPAAERNDEHELQTLEMYMPLMRHWHSSNWCMTGGMRVSYTHSRHYI